MGNDSKKGGENIPDNSAANAASDPSQDANLMDTEYANADAEVGKLAKDLEDLRQTLLRRQADFDNYRKRVNEERITAGSESFRLGSGQHRSANFLQSLRNWLRQLGVILR